MTQAHPGSTPPAPESVQPVLVVGATGDLGGKVVDALTARGKAVRALVRPRTNAEKLEARGVQIARGDMLDRESLVAAMTGVDAVITTAAGYTRGGKQANDIDTVGNSNLAEAARESAVRRFVLTSILTSDRTPGVPHFWHKKLAEDRLEALGVPFVALRPGAFLDQVTQMRGNPFEKGSTMWLGSTSVPLTFVLTTDLADNLAAAVDATTVDGERIDIGWDRPITMRDFARISTEVTGRPMRVRALPAGLLSAVGTVVGRWAPLVPDMAAMARWFDSGNYVADTARQREVFGDVPTAEDAITRFAARLGTAPA